MQDPANAFTAPTGTVGYRLSAPLAEVERAGDRVLALEGRTVALLAAVGQVYAIDNRCLHMGFPLDSGTMQDGILTCLWHHARFDLSTGDALAQVQEAMGLWLAPSREFCDAIPLPKGRRWVFE